MLRFRYLSALLIVALTACGAASDEQVLANVKSYQEKGETRTAIIELKALLQRSPDNAEARFALGELSLSQGDVDGAINQFSRIVDKIDNSRVFPLLGQALLARRDYEQIVGSANGVIPPQIEMEDSFSPQTREAIFNVVGEAYLGMIIRPDDAKSAFEAALKENSESVPAMVGLATLAMVSDPQDLDAAGQLLNQAKEINADNQPLQIRLGELAARQGDYSAAHDAFKRAVDIQNKQRPDHAFFAHMGFLQSQLQQKEYDGVLNTADSLERLAPGHPAPDYFRAQVAFNRDDLDLAYGLALKSAQKNPDYRPVQALLGSLHFARREYAQAESYLANILGADPTNTRVRKMLAQAQMQSGRPEDAASTLMSTDVADQDAQLLSMLGLATFQSGDVEQGIARLEQAVAANPDAETPVLQLAQAKLVLGNGAEAVKLLTGIPDNVSTFRRDALLVHAYLKSGLRSQADDTVKSAITKDPENQQIKLLMAQAYTQGGQFLEASKVLQTVVEQNPSDLQARRFLANAYWLGGDFGSAKSQYTEMLRIAPDDLTALRGMATIARREGELPKAIELLQTAVEKHPDDAQLHAHLAEMLIGANEYEQARVAADRAVALGPNQSHGHLMQGMVAAATQNFEQARRSFREALRINGDDHRGHYLMGRLELYSSRDLTAASASLERAVALRPDFFPGVQLLAQVKMRAGDEKGALALARNLASDNELAGSMLEGDLLMMAKQPVRALEKYEHASRLAPANRNPVIKAYLAKQAAGSATAMDPLLKWLGANPTDERMMQVVGDAHLARGENNDALTQYEKLIELNPRNAVALNNLAWVYHLAKKPEAQALAERAVEVMPGNGQIADTLGWILVAKGDKKSIEVLRGAVAKSEGASEIQYHLAFALAEFGEPNEAQRILQTLVDSEEPFPSKKLAGDLLQSLSAPN